MTSLNSTLRGKEPTNDHQVPQTIAFDEAEGVADLREMFDDPATDFGDLIAAAIEHCPEHRPVAGISSVASFFLSRIDVLVDKLLESKADAHARDLCGKIAVANAKLAYQSMKRIRAAQRWATLRSHGVRAQRLLWASTSTKNPDYPDLTYVEPLIGPMTISTMPEQTIAAVLDHGKVVAGTIEQRIEEAREVMERLDRLDIRFADVAARLEREGVQQFADIEVGRFSPLTYGRDLRVSRHDPEVLYAALSPAFRSYDGGIFRSVDVGRTWRRFDHGVKAEATMMGVAVDPRDPRRVCGVSKTGQVFSTADNGESWAESRLPEGAGDCYAIACG
jgi:Transaldolase/Fructose-6-phosphate aldolase